MISGFFRTLFSTYGFLIVLYIAIGILTNTAPPHIPSFEVGAAGSTMSLWQTFHSWIQYLISVMFWPLSFWQPTFTVSKWSGS
jgi:hypothetical protein